MMMWMFPPAPTPLPAPIRATDFLGPLSVAGMVAGRGVGASLVWGTDRLPSSPLPSALFFSGSYQGKGERGGAQRCLDLPRPLPHLSTQVPCSLLARHGFPEWTGGGEGRYEGPTPTLPPNTPSLQPPIAPPSPPEPLSDWSGSGGGGGPGS